MPTVVSTVGSASANSFVSVTNSDTYLDTVPNATSWESGDDDAKARALIEASRRLSALQWIGKRTDSTQALSWPRAYAENFDAPGELDVEWPQYFADDEIPPFLEEATYRLAFRIFDAGTTDPLALPDSAGIKRDKTGPLETEYFGPESVPSGIAKYPDVIELIYRYLDGAGTLKVSRV